MTSRKVAERKKSQKTKEKKQKKLSERTELVQQRKEEREAAREEKRTAYKGEPIVNEVLVANSEALDALEKNYEILRKLEEDYMKQQRERENLQEELESQGFKTLEEKMEHLKTLAKDRAENISEMFS